MPISKEVENMILAHSGIKNIKKGTLLLEEGAISNECYFVIKGCVKKYYMIDGDEKITGFYTEGQIVTPNSYTHREPSKYYLSTMEDTIVSFGDPDSESDLYEKYPELESVTRILVEKLMTNISDEFDNWVSNTPEDRYLQLLKQRPDLVQRIPQYQLANYLGIKPQSLSRIRKRLAQKENS